MEIVSSKSRIFKVVWMVARRLYLVMLLLIAGCQQPGVSEDKAAPAGETASNIKLSRQLRINKEALFEGTNEQMRMDAATVMLFSEDPPAREILLSALSQSKNNAAREAVCKVLIHSRGVQESIKDKDDFIPPLLEILATEDFGRAKLAAEATALFGYDKISEPLEKMVTDKSQPVKSRLNAIYALKLQPDMRAIFVLIKLLDDSEKQVSDEAEVALHSLGIPVGRDAATRKQIIEELKRKGREEFMRDWLVRQEAQMRQLEAEVGVWQKLYLSSLDKIYDGISSDAAKGQFLAEHLGDSKDIVRLWALEKISQWRVGTKSELPAELGPILVGFVSDPSKDIRLKTAKLLSLMGQLNSSQRLLEQLEVEQDDEVKTELFVALGGACYYASLPGSEINLAEGTREETLKWAAKFLLDKNPIKAQKGAEVIKKLLEQDGLSSGAVEWYLGLLAERYNRQKDTSDGVLRGELLGAMASLSGPRSAHQAEASKAFESLFVEALGDKASLVREAAVEGLINIDKTKALGKLRMNFASDSSAKVRRKVIELAGEVGNKDDLTWLAEKLSTSDGEAAWGSMLKIFNSSEMDVSDKWIVRFSSPDMGAKISDEQMVSFLEIAERKAVDGKNAQMLKNTRVKLSELYIKRGRYEDAAKSLGQLRETTENLEEREAILGQLLYVYLKWPQLENAVQLVNNCLLEKDLGSNSVIIQAINKYLDELPDGSDGSVVLKALIKIEPEKGRPRPMWVEQVQRWTERLKSGEVG